MDRAALDVAIHLDVEHGGWCPKGRTAEDGMIDLKYQLKETNSADYAVRTEKNVVDSDGTLILYRKKMTGGTLLTRKLTTKHRRPCLVVDLNKEVDVQTIVNWFCESNISVLNIAGPRASSDHSIYSDAQQCLIEFFEKLISTSNQWD